MFLRMEAGFRPKNQPDESAVERLQLKALTHRVSQDLPELNIMPSESPNTIPNRSREKTKTGQRPVIHLATGE